MARLNPFLAEEDDDDEDFVPELSGIPLSDPSFLAPPEMPDEGLTAPELPDVTAAEAPDIMVPSADLADAASISMPDLPQSILDNPRAVIPDPPDALVIHHQRVELPELQSEVAKRDNERNLDTLVRNATASDLRGLSTFRPPLRRG